MSMAPRTVTLLLLLTMGTATAWRSVSIDDFGAKGDNATINTAAFRSALAAVAADGGGELVVPP